PSARSGRARSQPARTRGSGTADQQQIGPEGTPKSGRGPGGRGAQRGGTRIGRHDDELWLDSAFALYRRGSGQLNSWVGSPSGDGQSGGRHAGGVWAARDWGDGPRRRV